MIYFLVEVYQKQPVLASYAPNPVRIRHRITEAVQSITQKLLRNVWVEFEFRLQVYIGRVPNGAHNEHL